MSLNKCLECGLTATAYCNCVSTPYTLCGAHIASHIRTTEKHEICNYSNFFSNIECLDMECALAHLTQSLEAKSSEILKCTAHEASVLLGSLACLQEASSKKLLAIVEEYFTITRTLKKCLESRSMPTSATDNQFLNFLITAKMRGSISLGTIESYWTLKDSSASNCTVHLTDNGRVCVLHSNNSSSTVEIPGITSSSRCVVLDNSIILTGGLTGQPMSSAFAVCLETRSVKTLVPLNTPRFNHSMTLINGLPAAIGGTATKNKVLDSTEILLNEQWVVTKPLKTARTQHTAATYNDYSYVFGGIGKGGRMKQSSIEQWQNEKWAKLKLQLPYRVANPGIIFLNSSTLLVLGGDDDCNNIRSDVNQLSLQMGTVEPKHPMRRGMTITVNQWLQLGSDYTCFDSLYSKVQYQLCSPIDQ